MATNVELQTAESVCAVPLIITSQEVKVLIERDKPHLLFFCEDVMNF